MNPKFEFSHQLTMKQLSENARFHTQSMGKNRSLRFIRWMIIIVTLAYGWTIRDILNDPLIIGAFALRTLLALPLLVMTSPRMLALISVWSLKKSYCTAPVKYAFEEDAAIVTLPDNPEKPHSVPYKEFIELHETADAFHLLNRSAKIVLPKSAFTPDMEQAFRAFISEKTELEIRPASEAGVSPSQPVPTFFQSHAERLTDECGFKVEHLLTAEQYKKYLLLQTRHTFRPIQIVLLVLFLLLIVLYAYTDGIQSSAFQHQALRSVFFLVLILFAPRLLASFSGFLYKKRYLDAPIQYLLKEEELQIVFADRFETPTSVPYKNLVVLLETDDAMYLLNNQGKDCIIVLPKNAFLLNELNEVRAFLIEKTGKEFRTIE